MRDDALLWCKTSFGRFPKKSTLQAVPRCGRRIVRRRARPSRVLRLQRLTWRAPARASATERENGRRTPHLVHVRVSLATQRAPEPSRRRYVALRRGLTGKGAPRSSGVDHSSRDAEISALMTPMHCRALTPSGGWEASTDYRDWIDSRRCTTGGVSIGRRPTRRPATHMLIMALCCQIRRRSPPPPHARTSHTIHQYLATAWRV